MKKLIAVLCCLSLLFVLAACGTENEPATNEVIDHGDHTHVVTEGAEDTPIDDASEAPIEDAHDHNHVSYKGLQAVFTEAEMHTAEGREPDFTVENSGITLYIYNDVTMDDLTFSQVQYTYHDEFNRISCTYTAEDGGEDMFAIYQNAMNELYGDSSATEHEGSELLLWKDGHTQNYITLSRLNDTTIQLAFYIFG